MCVQEQQTWRGLREDGFSLRPAGSNGKKCRNQLWLEQSFLSLEGEVLNITAV